MKIHLVGGFLGSGKTTAIAGAAKQLVAQGKRVGIITNDQGKHLVDTAFFRAQDFPAMEVTGGCFCCHFDDLGEQIEKIATEYKPDVIFAESVGSCADVVATVVKPLQELRSDLGEAASYSVFVDVRLLRLYLREMEMPFSEDVTYIFSKQLEEAGILVINKVDLMGFDHVMKVAEEAQLHFPEARIILQDSFNSSDISFWLDVMETDARMDGLRSLDINYERYARGEQTMAWLDKHYQIKLKEEAEKEALAGVLFDLAKVINEEQAIAGHLKFHLSGGDIGVKISAPTLQMIDQEFLNTITEEIKSIPIGEIDLWVNSLVVGTVERLEALVGAIINDDLQANALEIKELASFTRTPGFPKPTHRIA